MKKRHRWARLPSGTEQCGECSLRRKRSRFSRLFGPENGEWEYFGFERNAGQRWAGNISKTYCTGRIDEKEKAKV